VKRDSSSLQTASLSDASMVDYPLSAATAERTPVMENMLARARAFAEPLIADETLDTGENTLAHADAVAAIVAQDGRLRGHAGRQLPGVCLPAPEPPARGHRQGVRRQLRGAGGRDDQAGARAGAGALGRAGATR
jgi:hypothetical protein